MSFHVHAALAVLAVASDAHGGGIAVSERPDHVSEATVTVDATPAEVYALVTDYSNWQRSFHDIKSVKVESGGARDARVRFRSAALHFEVTVQFDNDENRAIRFRGVKGPPGGRAHGAYVLTPIDGGRRTQVTATLYMDVVGVPSVFIGETTIRTMREAKLRADLGDVARIFAARRAPSV